MAKQGTVKAGQAFVEITAGDQKFVGALKRAQARLKTFGNAAADVGRRMMAVGAASILPDALSARTFAEFEQSMARVRAITGASNKDFARLTARAEELGRTTVFTASEAAEALGFFALAGFKVDQMLKAIGPTLDLAAAGQMDIAKAADIVAKIMAGMGVAADDVGNAVDVLTKAFTTANTDLIQLGDAMKYVGPAAKAAGMSLEDTVAAIQLFSNAGIQADIAGTTLRGVLLSLTNPSGEAADELQKLGVAVMDTAGNVRPLADIIDDFNRGLAGMGTGQKLESIGKIFDTRQATGFSELLDQGGAKMRQFSAALKNATGTAARIAAVQLDTLRGEFTLLTSAAQGLGIIVGRAVSAPLRQFTRLVVSAVNATSEWAKNNQAIILTAALAGAGVLAAGAALIAMGTAAKLAGFGLSLVGSGLATLKFAAITAPAAILKGTLVALKPALLALASPMGIVAAAAVAMGAYFLYSSGAGGKAIDWLRTKFDQLTVDVRAAAGGIADALAAGDIVLAAKILWATLKLEYTKGVDALARIWAGFKKFFLATGLGAFHGTLAAWQEMQYGLTVAWTESTAFMGGLWDAFVGGILDVWDEAVGLLAKSLNYLKALFSDTFDLEAANKAIDDRIDQRQNQRASGEITEADRREQERRKKRKEAADEHSAAMARIGGDFNDTLAAIDANNADDIAQTESAVERLRGQLAELRKQAADRRAQAGNDEADGLEAPAMPDPKAIADTIAGAMRGAGVEARGLFNVAAIQSLQGPGDNYARNTAENTKKMATDINYIRNKQPVFTT